MRILSKKTLLIVATVLALLVAPVILSASLRRALITNGPLKGTVSEVFQVALQLARTIRCRRRQKRIRK